MAEEKYKPTYWNGKGKYQKEYNMLYAELVPSKGKAETTDGELLRCISRFYYEKYNNGFCNDMSYEIAYVNSYAWDADLDIHISTKMGEKQLDETIDKIIEYLMNKRSNKTEKTEMTDLRGQQIEVIISSDKKKLWVNTQERCVLRCQDIPFLKIKNGETITGDVPTEDMIDIPDEYLVYVPSNRKSTIEHFIDEGYCMDGNIELGGVKFTALKRGVAIMKCSICGRDTDKLYPVGNEKLCRRCYTIYKEIASVREKE